jgi:hypothetical protein
MDRSVKIVQHTSLGMFWVIGWLFSIGFLNLGFFQALLALLIWPYYLGAHFAAQAPPAAGNAYRMQQDAARSGLAGIGRARPGVGCGPPSAKNG